MLKIPFIATLSCLAIAFIFICSTVTIHVDASPHRIPNSVFPLSSLPTSRVYVINCQGLSDAELLLLGSLEGVLAKTQPRLVRLYGCASRDKEWWTATACPTDNNALWLTESVSMYNITISETYTTLTKDSWVRLLTEFGPNGSHEILTYIRTVLTWTTTDCPLNAALTVAAAEDHAIVIGDTTTEALVQQIGLTLLIDASALSGKTALLNYSQRLSTSILTILDCSSSIRFLSPYSIAVKSPILYYNDTMPDTFGLMQLGMNRIQPGSSIIGWGTSEWDLVDRASKHSSYVNCANYANGLTYMSNLNVPSSFVYLQYQGLVPQPVDLPLVPAVFAASPRHTVTFVMTDGDNLQWLLNSFVTKDWYNSTSRGSVPLGWGISNILPDVMPPTLSYLFRHMSNGSRSTFQNASSQYADYFISTMPAGYVFVDDYPSDEALQQLVVETGLYMQASNLRLLQVMMKGDGDEATCLRIGELFLANENIDAIIFYPYGDYSGLKGRIRRASNGKVITGGRYSLWSPQFEDPTSLAKKIMSLTTDMSLESSYSLIPVHVWSHTVEDVKKTMQLLTSNSKFPVDIVTPDVFIQTIQNNVKN